MFHTLGRIQKGRVTSYGVRHRRAKVAKVRSHEIGALLELGHGYFFTRIVEMPREPRVLHYPRCADVYLHPAPDHARSARDLLYLQVHEQVKAQQADPHDG